MVKGAGGLLQPLDTKPSMYSELVDFALRHLHSLIIRNW